MATACRRFGPVGWLLIVIAALLGMIGGLFLAAGQSDRAWAAPLFPVTVGNTTVEAEVSRVEVPASIANHNNGIFESLVHGTIKYKNGTHGTLTIRIKANGTTIGEVVVDPSNGAGTYSYEAHAFRVIRTKGVNGTATGTLRLLCECPGGAYAAIDGTASEHTVDTTQNVTFTGTVQWETADPANVFTVQTGYVAIRKTG